MKQKFKFIVPFIFAGVVFTACSQGEQETQATSPERKAERVKVMELQKQSITRQVEYPATLEPFEEVHLAPAAPGRIEGIFADVGDRIASGTPLVQMDRTQLHQAEVQLKNLEIDFNRLDTLAKYGSIPQQQYDQVKTQVEVAKTNVEFLRENTRLVAPFGGVISGRYYEPGEMYSGAPNTPAGKAAILSIVQIDNLKAMVDLSEKYFPLIKNGMEATITSDIYPGEEFSGRISRIYPTIDQMNRTFKIEIKIQNPKNILRPGMFSRVSLNMDEEEGMLLPSHAILKLAGSNERYLFKEEGGKARRVGVTLGKRYDDLIEVFSDRLNPGDKVIISGQARLVDGASVQIVD